VSADFSHILDWKLLRGGHEFPGPSGGTCVNEAAIVAAGFPYRKVRSAADCPPCFSRPIAAYALGLNDAMPDDVRQQLVPFVTRLAGSAGSPEIEAQRAGFIAVETVRRVLPLALRAAGLTDAAARCEAATTLDEAQAAAAAAAAEAAAEAAVWAARAAATAASWAAEAKAEAAEAAARAAEAANVWPEAIAILDGALRIGPQAEPVETAQVVARMEAAKQGALA
jgi:hypothetical protein